MPSDYDFDPQRDIAPYAATSLFDNISNDRRLTSRSRAQLQGDLLGGIQDIELQRLKLQEERDTASLRRQNLAQGSYALEAARYKRDQERALAEQSSGIQSNLRGIIDTQDADPVTRMDALNRLAFDNPAALTSPVLRSQFEAARDIIGKPARNTFTTDQEIEAGKYGVPEEFRNDPYKRGAYIGMEQQRRAKLEAERKNAEQKAERLEARDYSEDHETERARFNRLTNPIRLKADVDGTPLEFKDEDLVTRDLLLDEVATKEDRQKFEKAALADQHKILLDLQRRIFRGEKRPVEMTPQMKAGRSGL